VVFSWSDLGLARRPSQLTRGIISFVLMSRTMKSNLVVSPLIGVDVFGARRPTHLVRIIGSLYSGMLS
jgi:hypothetical protein